MINKLLFPACLLLAMPMVARTGLLGYWAGDLLYKGSPWRVGLTIQHTDTGHRVLLDVPDLIMYEKPIPCRSAGRSLLATFPFGIGDLNLKVRGDSIMSSNSDFRIALGRATPFASGSTELTCATVRKSFAQ